MPDGFVPPVVHHLFRSGMSEVCLVAGIMLLLSWLLERLILPAVPSRRPWGTWAVHGGICLVSYSLLVLLLGRPWFSMTILLAFLLLLILINNAKFKSLREPFLFQDYEYLTDAIRHPRLYIPFFGWGKTLLASAGFVLALLLGLGVEEGHATRWMLSGQLGAVLALGSMGGGLLWVGHRQYQHLSFKPLADLQTLGFLGYLWRYAVASRHLPAQTSPFVFPSLLPQPRLVSHEPLPHLVALQSESFFDPRSLYSGIRTEILAGFDTLKAEALAHGKLLVPAWGANTVRTEFAFLAGIPPEHLGVQQFNPYQAITSGWAPGSLAVFLKRLGYRTVCIHPYPASFYQRHRVYPLLGFDEFIDLRGFDPADRFGPYTSDLAVAAKLAGYLQQAKEPTFVFVITMENHGPLHLEQVRSGDVEQLYHTPPPPACDELTIYLRHLRNADAMSTEILGCLKNLDRPASLCWFGDHVPIMPSVYEALGTPAGATDYAIWSSDGNVDSVGGGRVTPMHAERLAMFWLEKLGLVASAVPQERSAASEVFGQTG